MADLLFLAHLAAGIRRGVVVQRRLVGIDVGDGGHDVVVLWLRVRGGQLLLALLH